MLLLAEAYQTMRSYGRTGADVEASANAFIRILSDCKADAVLKSFEECLSGMPEVPTPYDVKRRILAKQNKYQDG